MQNEIFLRRKLKISLEKKNSSNSIRHIATLLQNLQSLGFTLSKEIIDVLNTYSVSDLDVFHQEIVNLLKKMLGAHVKYVPMYPNFPNQVMEATKAELYLNAILHYFGDSVGARIMPVYDKEARLELKDFDKLKVISLGTEDEFVEIFKNLLSAKITVSESDKKDIKWFIENHKSCIGKIFPSDFPNKENLSYFVGVLKGIKLVNFNLLKKYFKTATDVLRFITAMSGGDVSLAADTKFKSLRRSDRKLLLSLLENCHNLQEDMLRFKNKWIRIGEIIHPGEYKNKYPKTFSAFLAMREDHQVVTFNSQLEEYIRTNDYLNTIKLLSTRPGEFARRLDWVLRSFDKHRPILAKFQSLADQVPVTILMQIMNHFQNRNSTPFRVFMPKGNIAKIRLEDNKLAKIHQQTCNDVSNICQDALLKIFATRGKLGNVYVDKKLKNYTMPYSLRSASKSLRTVSRGSRIQLDAGSTIRMFIWWKQSEDRVDIDLSGVLYDANWKYLEHVSWTNLRSGRYKAYHSGDITSAPNGASEFIDLDIESVLSFGGRYLVMNVISYTRQGFNVLPECFAGCMMRTNPASGEIYEPRTVKDKFDLTTESNYCIPLIFDLKKNEIIWCDLALNSRTCYNTIENNKNGIVAAGRAFTEVSRPNLYDLFLLHAKARGNITTKKNADIIFGVQDGDVMPFDLDKIVANYL